MQHRAQKPIEIRGKANSLAAGYAFVVVMTMVTVLLVSLATALPSIYQEGQREREEEAIFRANQYARAIFLFHRQFGRFPASVKDLLNANGSHFLRKAWRDPLSPNGRWRFIHANGAGILIDSWDQTSQLQTPHAMPLAAGSANGQPSSSGLGQGAFGLGQTTSQPGQTTAPTGLSQPQSGFSASQSGSAPGQPGEQKKTKHPPSTCDGSESQGGLGSSDSSIQTGTLLGAFIVGVAPCSDKQSIRVLDKKKHYDEWEVLGTTYVEYGIPKVQAVPANQNQPGQSSPFQSNPGAQPGLMPLPSNASPANGFGASQPSNSVLSDQQ